MLEERRNPRFGHQRIANQISYTFTIHVDKDAVRRVLTTHYKPELVSGGPSWLTFLGYTRDSLWNVDMFRCDSIILRSHWVMVAMDQNTQRITGFAVHSGTLDGPTLCRMLTRIRRIAHHDLELRQLPAVQFQGWQPTFKPNTSRALVLPRPQS